jgi:hypothetical protein
MPFSSNVHPCEAPDLPRGRSRRPDTRRMPPAPLLHHSVALGTPLGKKISPQRPGWRRHAKMRRGGPDLRAEGRSSPPRVVYDEYARILSRRQHRIAPIPWSMSICCRPARRAVPNVYFGTNAASDPRLFETCVMSIRRMSIPTAHMLKEACRAPRQASCRSMSTPLRLS